MITVQAQKRDITGKQVARLRKDGLLPGVLYGSGTNTVPVQVSAKEFDRVFKEAGESTIITLNVSEGEDAAGKDFNVLVHDIARDPVKNTILHVDFYAVRMDKPITAKVPIVVQGEAPAVKNLGGVLVQSVREVEIEALPKDLPHELTIDVSGLEEIDTHRTVSDIPVANSVKILAEPDEVVVTIIAPRVVEEEVPAEEVAAADIPVAGKEEKAVEGEETPQEGGETVQKKKE